MARKRGGYREFPNNAALGTPITQDVRTLLNEVIRHVDTMNLHYGPDGAVMGPLTNPLFPHPDIFIDTVTAITVMHAFREESRRRVKMKMDESKLAPTD